MDELKNSIIELIPDIQEAINNGVAYSSDLFTRYITYSIYMNIFDIVFYIIGFIFFSIITFIACKYVKNNHEELDIFIIFFIITLVIIFCFLISTPFEIIKSTKELIKISTIPEIYVIEQFNEITKKK